jgi:hypothetical protein
MSEADERKDWAEVIAFAAFVACGFDSFRSELGMAQFSRARTSIFA